MRKPQGKIKNDSVEKRTRRKLSIRKKVIGSSERPRICVSKTNKHLSVQVIDDQTSKTILCVQTFGKKAVQGAANNVEGAKVVGAKVAEALKSQKLNVAVFDRAGYKYTGVVAALANAIRENGIQV
jgi:large subunit ribosomal protein L18